MLPHIYSDIAATFPQAESIMQFLQQNQVNKQRWDDCIKSSPHGLIYAQSFYLDAMCPGWSAIADEEYNWVMPLTYRKKWGISYLYQPAFTQQLGVFAKNENVIIPWEELLTTIKKKYRFWEISFNHATPNGAFSDDFKRREATNFILPLSTGYNQIRLAYHNDLKRNLKRGEKFRLVYRPHEDFKKAIEKYKNYYRPRMPHVQLKDYERFAQLAATASEKNMIVCRKAINQQNELLAIVLLLNDGKRLYNLMNTTTTAGRKTEANHFLMNEVIKEFAGTELLLDFEGSDLPGVRAFYQNFGAFNQPYFQVRFNRLPWPVNLLKR